MRLTYDEFRTLTMRYVFGINAEEYCARRYINEQFGIVKEVVTPRKVPGDHYSGFGAPDVCFYIGNGQTYPTARELYEGKFLTPWHVGQSPVREGWYETDRGMLFWSPLGWLGHDDDVFTVLPPKQWRGMADVQSNPTPTESNA
jgi:hypothetical protein